MLLAILAMAALQDPMAMVIRPVAPGVHVISGFANGNILVVEGSDKVLLVDAQSGKRVGLADSALRTVTRKPVRQVAFTHYHEDHTQGMSHWRAQGAVAVAHQSVAPQMAKDTIIADWENWHRTPAAPEAMPDRTFADSMVISLGTRRVVLVHVPGAHTDGDAMAWRAALPRLVGRRFARRHDRGGGLHPVPHRRPDPHRPRPRRRHWPQHGGGAP